MRNFMKLMHTVLFSICVSTGIVQAQGNLSGVITDQFDGTTLYGATAIIVGTSLGSATDNEGRYVIRRIPAGEVEVRFSYIGYESKIFNVTIVDGETLDLDVELSASTLDGVEIQISAQALGQVAAINQQRSSNTIINVVSEEKIKELPDANAAESIGRLPGVSVMRSGGEANKVILRGLSDKYLNVTIDGVRLPTTDALSRGLDLSAISQNSLAGIELFKAVTPDKDADAIAGSINLVTRKAAPEQEIRISALGGYNSLMNSYDQYDLSGKYGNRFFSNLIGFQINANLESKIRSNERINISYSDKGVDESDYFISDLELEFIDERRSRSGIGAILDVNTPDNGNIKISSMYSSTTRDYLIHSRNYPFSTASVNYEFRNSEQQIDVFSNSLIGNNRILGIDTDWVVSYSRSATNFPFDYRLQFVEPSSQTSGMRNPVEIKDQPQQLTEYAFNNFQAASISEGYDYTQENSDAELSARIDLAREYILTNSISGRVKGGSKYSTKNRMNENTRAYSPYRLGYWRAFQQLPDGTIAPKDFGGSHFEGFYQNYLANPSNNLASFSYFLNPDPRSKFILDDFNMNPLISRERLRQWYSINRNGINQAGTNAEYHNDPSAEANTYDITESVTAGYLMNTLHFGQTVTAIFGARIEHENHDYTNRFSPGQIGGFPIPLGSTRDTSSTYSETIFLPHLHINIQPTELMNIRMAAYRAVARPDFNMRLLSFFAWREADISAERILVIGNPELKTAKAWNFEINTAFYGNRLGLFSVSAFYKKIDDMYHMLDGISTVGDTLITNLGLDWKSPHRGSYELTVPYNSPDASHVWGLEMEHQFNLYWLPGLLRNIVLSYNASLVKSRTTLISATTDTTYVPDPIFGQRPVYSVRPITTTQRLENQPYLFGNISLGYDIGGFSGRLSLFHQSEYYRSYSPLRRGDRITGAFSRLDLAVKYKITDYLMVVANVNNLTNIKETDLRHNQVHGYKIPRVNERYGVTFDAGVRLEL
jgi:TonB-dependent receptor